MSNVSKRRKEVSRAKIKSVGDHKEFLRRITKTLYYGQLPALPCLSLPVTEISCEVWSAAQRGRSLRRLHADAAAGVARQACVSPCALVLAMLYLERLHACNPDYLAAVPPADLFLVSLMVGNKFLQDDGEDDEVLCSEWAASGDLELHQLKQLEVEFLNAIDWNVFVNDKCFESGLSWLERRVALKQAQQHGFFTYTDLVAAYDSELLAALLRSVTSSCLAVALGYLASIMTLVTSTLFISQAWLPAVQHAAASSAALHTNVITNNSAEPTLAHFVPNATIDSSAVDSLAEDFSMPEKIQCCNKWLKYRESAPKENWHHAVDAYDWKPLEPGRSKASVLHWLYRSSLIDPLQRWLERINEYADFVRHELSAAPVEQCEGRSKQRARQRCVRSWLNLSRLGALVVSVSDR